MSWFLSAVLLVRCAPGQRLIQRCMDSGYRSPVMMSIRPATAVRSLTSVSESSTSRATDRPLWSNSCPAE